MNNLNYYYYYYINKYIYIQKMINIITKLKIYP